MQARIDQVDPSMPAAGNPARAGEGCKSVGEFVRQWGPYVITALVVPGGIAIVLLLLFRRWNQGRPAVSRPVRS